MTERVFDPTHPRGFLQFLSDDVIAVVNGQPVTKSDTVASHRAFQRRRLAVKSRSWEDRVLPCFVRVDRVPSFPFMGWWLYVDTAYRSFNVDRHFDWRRLALQAMMAWPCGYLPMIENYNLWKQAMRGRVQGWAVIDSSERLLEIRRHRGND